ncbi:MAG: hypothetical protein GY758_30300 [Fuerstiella sp.]|nr:hypothetical protein [Fuerstiella sp.]MDG2129636.1 hypothetical protein [Fuerstiella sp.]
MFVRFRSTNREEWDDRQIVETRRLTDVVESMPVEVTDKSQVFRNWLTILATFCLLLAVAADALATQESADTEGGDPPNQAGAASVANNNPATAYLLEQQKLVRDLRRLQKSLLTPEIVAGFGSENRAYRGLLRTGVRRGNARELEILQTCLKYRAYSLSDPTIQKDPGLFEASFKNLLRDLSSAGAQILNAGDKQRYRELLCGELLPFFNELLENNLYSRSAALELLLDFGVAPARSNRGIIMYDQMDDILVKVLSDVAQPDVVKTRAANVCKKFLQKADVTPLVQITLANTLISELQRPFTAVAYQNTLLSALDEIDTPRELVGQKRAIVMLAATTIIEDNTRDILIRCRAARVLGRCGFDSSIDFDVLAWKVGQLTLESGVRFNQAKNKKAPKWQLCGWHLYLAFHHEKKKETEKGFLNRADKSKLVRSGYEASLPVMVKMMRQDGAVSATSLNALNGWEGKNKPANLKFDPASPALK